MVRRSNAISRETCQIQKVDGGSSTTTVRNAVRRFQARAMRVDISKGNETNDSRSKE
jgi:hypothetical protein